MSAIAKFDIRTLLACQLLLALVFSLVFLAMKLAYRKLHGMGSLSCAFLLGVPGIVLVTFRGSVPYFVSVVVGNGLILFGFLLMYRCVLRFQENRHPEARQPSRKFWGAAATVFCAMLSMTWFTVVHDSIVPRIVTVSISTGILFSLVSVELFRQAAGRVAMHLFALSMIGRALGCLYRVIFTLIKGAPSDFMQSNSVQAISMSMAVLSVSLLGIFFLIMVSGELTFAVQHLASHDPLTGALNRHGIESILTAELDRARRNKHPLSAVLIDLDRFKSINDTGGHAAGDAALRTVAHGISSSLRSYDLLGRYGGDEFLLLLPETSALHAVEVAERIRTLLTVSTAFLEPALRPTVSMGVAETLSGDTVETLLARADAALYDAKHAGRNCVRHRITSGSHPIQTPVSTSNQTAPPAIEFLKVTSFDPTQTSLQA
ncbi:GGDEF domain-containing protein [Granulicella sp. dw_53]|uniref:GGDEF domain-containing protein n=1 Tax=Granulicella sp. dw_53 TaxID=2719792 RepID=UPI001BD6C401|nr:GGDEF domain-containing protein [Granulicella sp. dw_53]